MTVLSTTTAASQILSNTLSVLKTVREQAQTSKDSELKSRISDLYDNVLELKEAVMRVTDENKQLLNRIAELEQPSQNPVIKQVGDTNYYFVGEEGPYCQRCYDGDGKLVKLPPSEDWNRGVRRICTVCHQQFYEKRMDLSPIRLSGRRRPSRWT